MHKKVYFVGDFLKHVTGLQACSRCTPAKLLNSVGSVILLYFVKETLTFRPGHPDNYRDRATHGAVYDNLWHSNFGCR
ncbi:MAG: hypothetical protein E6H06_11100 [Bacteroidetes bacterium]|nr:MAG: hypothetical protein E6H06_11100 [Bacteroidota bacterium]